MNLNKLNSLHFLCNYPTKVNKMDINCFYKTSSLRSLVSIFKRKEAMPATSPDVPYTVIA